MDPVVEKNLLLMRPKNSLAYNMRTLAAQESMGGNADSYKKRPCAGVNFFYDAATGEIVAFGNSQSIPPAMKVGRRAGAFRLVMDWYKGKGTGKYNIIEVYRVPAGHARDIIDESIAIYNREFGFPLDSLEEAA